MAVYRNLRDGTGDRESLFLCYLFCFWCSVAIDAERRGKADFFQIFAGNRTEVFAFHLVQHVDALRVCQDVKIDVFYFFAANLSQKSEVQGIVTVLHFAQRFCFIGDRGGFIAGI